MTFRVLGMMFLGITAVQAAEWPQWRGANRDGIVNDKNWPDTLDEKHLQLSWKVENLGPSYSGPIVHSGILITTQTVDKKEECVLALDAATGKQLWKQQWPGSMTVPFFAAKNGSWIRSTPATDGNIVVVAGIRDLVIAFDLKSGKELWRYDTMSELKSELPTFGCVCSPLIDDKSVYIQAGGGMIKLDKKTGKLLWTTLKDGGGMMGSAFSSPVLGKISGVEQLIVQTRTQLAGVNPDDGKVLWKKEIPSFRGMNILTPVIWGDNGIFTSTYGGNTRLLRIKSQTEGTVVADEWSLRYEGNMSTPVVVDGHAYFLGKDKRCVCVNLENGQQTFRSEKTYGEYWNLISNGEKILALDQRGTLYLLKTNPKELTILSERKVADSESWAHIAITGDRIFIRDLSTLKCWKWSK